MTLAALGIKATVDGVDKATDQLDRLAGAAGGAEKATDKLRDSSGRFVKAGNDAAGAAGKAADETNRLGKETRTAEGSLARLAGGLGTVVGKLAAMAAAALSVGAYIKLADSWSDLRSQLGAAIGDMGAASDMMQRMVDIANASYSPLDQTVQVYARNVGVLRDLGKSAAEAADFTESLNHMLVITATKGERAESVQNALSKAMAVGALQADGLETVLANGGRVAQALADELGTTVSGLRALASEGKITGQVIADSIIKPLNDVREVAGEMPATVGDAFTRIGTSILALVGNFDQAFNVSGTLATALVAVGDGLASMAQTDFAAWADGVTGALVGLAQIALVLAATRLPALVVSMAAVNISGGIMTAQFIAGAIASRAYTIAIAAQAAAARGLSAAVAMMGGPWGIAAATATALGIAIYSAWQPAKSTAETLNTLAAAQDEVTRATKAFNVEMTTNSVNAMVAAAEANIGIIQNEIELTKKAWESANSWRLSLGPNEGMIAASEKIIMLQEAMAAAEAVLAEKRAQAAAFVEQQVAGVVHLNEEQQKALQSANEMTRSFEQRAALARTELQYGRDSAQYLQEQLNQERQIQFAKIAALDITNQQKEAARRAYDQMVMAEAKTRGWNVELSTTNTRLNSAYQALVKIRDTQPGSGWLSTAIQKAATLATTLWDAVAANSALSNLSVSEGPGMTTGNSDWANNSLGFRRPGSELLPPSAQGGSGGGGGRGGGGGGGGGGADGALSGLISELSTERELLTVWYEEKLALIQSYSDRELEAVGGRHGALERLEAEHQERLRALGSDTNNQRLQDMAGFFGGMADLARSGGERTLKIAQGLAAIQGVVNSYLAFTEVLKDPAYVGRPWARFGAAASALASGLAAVRSIKSASSAGGGGGVPSGGGGNAGSAQQSAPETPLRVTLDTIDPGAIYSGSAMIKMFEAIQKEAGNRGIVWVPAGA